MNAIANTLHKFRRRQKNRQNKQVAGVVSVGIVYMVQLTASEKKLKYHIELDLKRYEK